MELSVKLLNVYLIKQSPGQLWIQLFKLPEENITLCIVDFISDKIIRLILKMENYTFVELRVFSLDPFPIESDPKIQTIYSFQDLKDSDVPEA